MKISGGWANYDGRLQIFRIHKKDLGALQIRGRGQYLDVPMSTLTLLVLSCVGFLSLFLKRSSAPDTVVATIPILVIFSTPLLSARHNDNRSVAAAN